MEIKPGNINKIEEGVDNNAENIDFQIEAETKKLESSAIEMQSEIENLGGEEGIMKSIKEMDENKREEIMNKIDSCLNKILDNKTFQTILQFSYAAGVAGLGASIVARIANIDNDAIDFLSRSSFVAFVVPLATKMISLINLMVQESQYLKNGATEGKNNLE